MELALSWISCAGICRLRVLNTKNMSGETGRQIDAMKVLQLLNGLRFIDSFFPSGGFAFSSGLEAAVQGGVVGNAASYQEFVTDQLCFGLGTREAVAIGLTWDRAQQGVMLPVVEVDRQVEAMQLSEASRKASRQMGRQVLRVAAEQFQSLLLDDYRASVESGVAPGHLPITMGLTLWTAGWGKQAAIAGFLYQALVGYNAAAMKLLPIGQRESQRLLHEWLPQVTGIAAAAAGETRLSSWTPVHDVYAMRHSRLESRLFRS